MSIWTNDRIASTPSRQAKLVRIIEGAQVESNASGKTLKIREERSQNAKGYLDVTFTIHAAPSMRGQDWPIAAIVRPDKDARARRSEIRSRARRRRQGRGY